jgi:geranylgeranyl reductase
MLTTGALVIGGGPAGATAARYLASSGIDTILVERDCSYIKPCGGAIPSGGFHEFGLPPHLIKRQIGTMTVVAPSGERVDIAFKDGAIFMTERGHFDRALRDLAITHGAGLIEGSFMGFDDAKRGYAAVIRRKSDGALVKILTPHVLAADGIAFTVGRRCGLRRPQVVYAIHERLDRQAAESCEFWFGTDQASCFYSWVFPGDGGISVGTGSGAPERLHAQLERFLKIRFDGTARESSPGAPAKRNRVFPLPVWSGEVFSRGSVLFLGDAAGMVMPVTYEGIYYAMKAGEFAARAVIAGKPADYARLWNDRFRTRFRIMSTIRRFFFRSDTAIERWVSLHKNPEIQELAMSLWLRKDQETRHLAHYFRAFVRLIAT